MTLRSFRPLPIVGGLLIVSALILAVLAGLGGLGSGMSVSQMAPATAESLAQTRPGTTILLHGRMGAATVHPKNAPDGRLVMWTARLRMPNADHWLDETLIKHSFVVDIGPTDTLTQGMQVLIGNENYGLAPLPLVIDEADYVVNGLGIGDSVVIVGQLGELNQRGQWQVNAFQVAPGSQDDLVRHLQGSDWQFMILSAVLTVAGAGVLLLDRVLPVRQTALKSRMV